MDNRNIEPVILFSIRKLIIITRMNLSNCFFNGSNHAVLGLLNLIFLTRNHIILRINWRSFGCYWKRQLYLIYSRIWTEIFADIKKKNVWRQSIQFWLPLNRISNFALISRVVSKFPNYDLRSWFLITDIKSNAKFIQSEK